MCNRLPEIKKNGDAGIFPVYYSLNSGQSSFLFLLGFIVRTPTLCNPGISIVHSFDFHPLVVRDTIQFRVCSRCLRKIPTGVPRRKFEEARGKSLRTRCCVAINSFISVNRARSVRRWCKIAQDRAKPRVTRDVENVEMISANEQKYRRTLSRNVMPSHCGRWDCFGGL